MKRKASYDYYLVLATAGVLFIISLVCIYGMFAFKLAQIQQMDAAVKFAYMDRMNRIVSPFLIILILLLGICVPKRLLPTAWLNRFAVALAAISLAISLAFGVKTALLAVLIATLVLQTVVLALALAGSERLHFEKSGYWLRVGSSLMHLGLVLFVLDLFFYKRPALHLTLFWVTTVSTILGMLFCFYSNAVAGLLTRKPQK